MLGLSLRGWSCRVVERAAVFKVVAVVMLRLPVSLS